MSVGRTVLVTGASGFLGRHVGRSLAEAGWSIRGLSRDPGEVEGSVAGDVRDREVVRRAVEGADAIVHLAARVHVMEETAPDPLAAFRAVNVEGTRVLVEEAGRAGAERFVFASSVKAVAEESAEPLTEGSPPRPVDPYGISKLEAERLIEAAVETGGPDAVVLRLPLVYGPGMRGNMLSLFRAVDCGLPLPLGGVRNLRSLVYAGNVAAAVRGVLAAPDLDGYRVRYTSDARDLSTPELVREIARALDRPVRLLPIPALALRGAARIGGAVSRALPLPDPRPAVDRVTGSLRVDGSRLWAELGFGPPFGVREAMGATAGWFRSREEGE